MNAPTLARKASPFHRRWRKLQQRRTNAAQALLQPETRLLNDGSNGTPASPSSSPLPQSHASESAAFIQTLQQPLPPPHSPVHNLDYLVIDIESSGLDPQQNEIISIGWVAIDRGRIQLAHSAHHIVAPPLHRQDSPAVGQSAVIHGIRDCDRDQGLPLVQALTHLFTALHGRWPVFHHGPLDLGFLNRACQQLWHSPWPTLYVDTLHWHRQRLGRRHHEMSRGKLHLSAVMAYHHIPPRNAHNALDDALSCAEVMIALGRKSRANIATAAAIHYG